MRKHWCYWKEAGYHAFRHAPRFSGMTWRTAITAVAGLAIGLFLLWLKAPENVEPEWFINVNTLVYPLAAIFGLSFVLELLRYPIDREKERDEQHKTELANVNTVRERLEKEKSEIQERILTTEKMAEGANILADLLEDAQKIHDDTKHDPMEERNAWYEKVRGVLREYHPLSEASFRSVHSFHMSQGWRDILREEMKKLSVILVSIRDTTKK